jgi:hypothetical protein
MFQESVWGQPGSKSRADDHTVYIPDQLSHHDSASVGRGLGWAGRTPAAAPPLPQALKCHCVWSCTALLSERRPKGEDLEPGGQRKQKRESRAFMS